MKESVVPPWAVEILVEPPCVELDEEFDVWQNVVKA